MTDLTSLLGEEYMKRFTLVKSSTLFEPTKEDLIDALSRKLCPLCNRKLYPNRELTFWRCKSKRKDKFFIRAEVLKKFLI